jgi:hypothetical protein
MLLSHTLWILKWVQHKCLPIPPKGPTEFEKVTLAQVQGENQRAELANQLGVKKLEI